MSDDAAFPGSGPGEDTPPARPLRVLVVDDDRRVAESIGVALRLAGHAMEVVSDPEEALSMLTRIRPDAVLLDLNYGHGRSDGDEGLALLRRLATDDPDLPVVVITAHSGVRVAVAAIRAGARDFVMKPWRNAELIAKLEAAARPRPRPSTTLGDRPAAPAVRLLGDSAAMEAVRGFVRRAGPTAADVLIAGPPGAGRSAVAEAIHAASPAPGPLARVDLRDAAAWPALAAATGTMLLRGADALDGVAQRRLCDLLPTGLRCLAIVDRLAALTPALHRRLATLEIAVPPLAARRGDAVVLARHFARVAAERHGRPPPGFTPGAQQLLAEAPWPDEVRGLGLAVERAVLLSSDGTIDAALLTPGPMPEAGGAAFDLQGSQCAVIAAALRAHGHNVTQAAAALGLSRGALYRRMAEYGL